MQGYDTTAISAGDPLANHEVACSLGLKAGSLSCSRHPGFGPARGVTAIESRHDGGVLPSPRSEVSALDRYFSALLPSVSLVAELDVSAVEVERLASNMGLLVAESSGYILDRDLRNFSAALAVLMPTLGAEQYSDATYWRFFWDRLGVAEHRRIPLQGKFGEAYLRALDVHGLPAFPDVPNRFVDNILMHAGVPTSLIGRWFRLIDQGIREVGNDPDALLALARRRIHAGGFHGVPKPLQRFIDLGGDFAEDLLDRSVDLLTAVRSGDDNLTGVGLSETFVAAARDHVSGRPSDPVGRSRTRKESPKLVLDVEGGQLVLQLPEVSGLESGLTWIVRTGNSERRITPRRLRREADITFKAEQIPITAPVAVISVSTVGVDEELAVPVIDDTSEIIAFTQSGRRLPAGRPLPDEPVWFVAPNELKLSLLGDGVATEPRVDLGSPIGWDGWSLRLWDLNGCLAVHTGRQSIRVSNRSRAQIRLDVDAATVHATIAGLPIMRSRPAVVLPSGLSADWLITVKDRNTNRTVNEIRVSGDGLGTTGPIDPFSGWSEPLLGAFRINVKGPLGRGANAELAIAEGLRIRFDKRLRVFTPAGLTPTVAEIAFPGGECAPGKLEFEPSDYDCDLQLRTGNATATVTVRPPALEIAVDVQGATSGWQSGPVTISTEQVGNARLLLRAGEGAEPVLYLAKNAGAVQELEPVGVRSGRYVSYALAKASDAIRATGANRLILGLDAGPASIRVATFQPPSLANGVEIVGDDIQLQGFAGMETEVVAWSTGQPWRAAQVLQADDVGRIPLTPQLRCGRVAVVPRVRDDWRVQPIPRFPYRRSVLTTSTGFPTETDASPLEQVLTGSIQSVGFESIEPDGFDLSQVWGALILDHALHKDDRLPATISRALSESLRRRSRQAVEPLGEYALPAVESAAHLLRTGLASLPTASLEPPDLAAFATLAGKDAVAAVLAYSHWLVEESDRGAAMRAELIPTLGEVGVEFILTGIDGAAPAGRFDAFTPNLARMERDQPSQFENFVAQIKLVPKGLLQADSRVAASMELMNRRRAAKDKGLQHHAAQLVSATEKWLRGQGFTQALGGLEARKPDGNTNRDQWLHLSAASLAWALMSRYAAYGFPQPRGMLHKLPAWQQRGHALAPMLAVDLCIAEIYAAHDQARS